MPTPLENITSGLTNFRAANRVDGNKASYRKDNPVEYGKVMAYLDGGERPTDVVTEMGIGLLKIEDARRGLQVQPEPEPEPEPEPTPAGFDIPNFRVALQAGSGPRIGWWRQYGSDNNTWAHENDGGRTPQLATPAPGQKRTMSGPRSWVWWFCGSITIPSGFPAVGRAFATINPHNSALDVGPSGMGGIGWGFGSGVSNVHIFYAAKNYPNADPNSFFLSINPSPTQRWPLVANVEAGKRYDFVEKIILGRRDKELGLAGPGISGGGIGNHPNNGNGQVIVWVNGQQVVDTGIHDTLLRATAPDGKTYTQTLMHRPWDGAYVVPDLSQNITMIRTMTRVGTTLEEALADEPPHTLRSEWGEGGGSFTSLSPLKSDQFIAPK